MNYLLLEAYPIMLVVKGYEELTGAMARIGTFGNTTQSTIHLEVDPESLSVYFKGPSSEF